MKQWHAVVFPLFLTSLMYAGSLLSKTLLLVNSWKEYKILNEADSFDCIRDALLKFFDWTISVSSNVVAWRNYVVVSISSYFSCSLIITYVFSLFLSSLKPKLFCFKVI